MKIIIHEAYYQKKKWLFAQANNAAYQEKLRMTPEEQETAQKKIKDKVEHFRWFCNEWEQHSRYVPNFLGKLRFRLALRNARAVAENYELNICAECDDSHGTIHFVGDCLMSDTVWKDGKYKRALLLLIWLADSVHIDGEIEGDANVVNIHLSYRIANRII